MAIVIWWAFLEAMMAELMELFGAAGAEDEENPMVLKQVDAAMNALMNQGGVRPRYPTGAREAARTAEPLRAAHNDRA